VILADTSVWINALREGESAERLALDALLAQQELAMTGVVLSELLQGTRAPQEFTRLATRLRSLPFLLDTIETWTKAAELAISLRRLGLFVPLTDLEVAAVAMEHHCEIYTLDDHFNRIPGVKLYQP
jgi:predicted nucleic acid-binding protein